MSFYGCPDYYKNTKPNDVEFFSYVHISWLSAWAEIL